MRDRDGFLSMERWLSQIGKRFVAPAFLQLWSGSKASKLLSSPEEKKGFSYWHHWSTWSSGKCLSSSCSNMGFVVLSGSWLPAFNKLTLSRTEAAKGRLRRLKVSSQPLLVSRLKTSRRRWMRCSINLLFSWFYQLQPSKPCPLCPGSSPEDLCVLM